VIRRFGGGEDMPLQLLTKGDVSSPSHFCRAATDDAQNNAADDTELYAKGQNFLDRKEDVIGSVVGYGKHSIVDQYFHHSTNTRQCLSWATSQSFYQNIHG
jgi:hypothetical protein